MEGTQYQAPGQYGERRRGSIVGPVILILAGVLLLGQALGWFPSTIWTSLLNYWPVLLILVGAELILGRGSWVSALVLGLAVIAFVSLLTFVAAFPVYSDGITTFRVGSFAPVETIRLAEPVGQADRASYQLEFGAGSLNVSALPATSASLFEATLERDQSASIDKSVVRRGDLTAVTIDGRNLEPVRWGRAPGRTRMAVQLSPQTPSELRVNGGAGELDLDLSALPVTHLELNAGVGGSRIVLPKSPGLTSATVNVGVGGVDVTIPEGVAAQIRVDRGIGGISVDEGRFRKVSGDTYRSANYDSAANQVDLYISGGVGGISVK